MSAAAFQLQRTAPGTLGVDGVLSFATAAAALAAINAALAGEPVARLDLSGVRHSDSAGLACVLAVLADAAEQGRSLTVRNIPEGMHLLASVCEVEGLLA